jgi:hypothetical protein
VSDIPPGLDEVSDSRKLLLFRLLFIHHGILRISEHQTSVVKARLTHEAQTLGRPGPPLGAIKRIMPGELELVPLEALAACGATPAAGGEDAVAWWCV